MDLTDGTLEPITKQFPTKSIWEFLPEDVQNIIMTELVKLDYRFFSVYKPNYWCYIITTSMYEKVITVDFLKNMIKYNYEHYKTIIPQGVYNNYACRERYERCIRKIRSVNLKPDYYFEIYMYPEMYFNSYMKDLVMKCYYIPSNFIMPVKRFIDKYLYSDLKLNIKHSMDDFATLIKYLSTYITCPETTYTDSMLEIFIEGVRKYKSFMYYLEYKLITDIFQFRIYIAMKIRSLFPGVVLFYKINFIRRFKHDTNYLQYFFENTEMTDEMRKNIFNLHISECYHFLKCIYFDETKSTQQSDEINSILNNETDIIEKTISFKHRLNALLTLKFYHIRTTDVFKKLVNGEISYEDEEQRYFQELNNNENERENGRRLENERRNENERGLENERENERRNEFENGCKNAHKGYLNDFYLYRVLVTNTVFDPYIIKSEMPLFSSKILFDDVYIKVISNHSKYFNHLYSNIYNGSDSDLDNDSNNDSDNDSDIELENDLENYLNSYLESCSNDHKDEYKDEYKHLEQRVKTRLDKSLEKCITKRLEKRSEINISPVYDYFFNLVYRMWSHEIYEFAEKKYYLF